MKMNKILLVVLVTFLAGCASHEDIKQVADVVDKQLKTSRERKTQYVLVKDQAFIFSETDGKLISPFYKNRDVSVALNDPLTIQQAIVKLNWLLPYKGNFNSNCGTDQSETSATNDPSFEEANIVSNERRYVQYTGKLSGLFSYLENTYDVKVTPYDGGYGVSSCETKSISINGLLTKLDASLNTSSSGEGESSGGSFSLNMDLKADLPSELLAEMTAILSSEGKVHINANTSSVLITDKPSVIKEATKIAKRYNDLLDKQILLLVTMLEYSDTDTKELGLDWDGAVTSGATSVIPGSEFAKSLVNSGLGLEVSNSKSTTDLFISSYFSDATAVANTQVDLLMQNGVPTPFSLTATHDYISSISVEKDKDTNSETRSVEVSSLSEGFKMMFRALTTGDKISVNAFISQNELISMQSQQGVTLPVVSTHEIMQSFKVASSDMIILTGLKIGADRSTNTSAVPGTIIAGGSNSNTKLKRNLVVLIEPRLINE